MLGNIECQPRLVILTGPSGGGKDCTQSEIGRITGCGRIVTYCAGREIRDDEINGVSYNFISRKEFNRAKKAKEFFESFPYRETLKGTKKGQIERARTELLLWRIDPNSAAKMKTKLRRKGYGDVADKAITIYIGVPDVRTLYGRQQLRDPVPPKKIILNRMKEDWEDWKKYGDRYDFVVINKDGEFENTIKQVLEIITRVPQSDAF
jgi:guanylate kinase